MGAGHRSQMMSQIEEGDVTYWQHLSFAARIGLVMVLAGFCVLVHAICPKLFKTTGSDAVRELYYTLGLTKTP